MESNRRNFIAAIGASAVIGTAGCSGSSSGGSYGTSYGCETVDLEDNTQSLSAPTIGPDDAENTVLVMEDFSCPHCRDFHTQAMPGLKSKATDESSAVDFNIKHVDAVIPVSEWSTNYANAGRYIQDNYDDQAFFTFAEAVFNTFNRQDWQSVGDSLTEADVLSSPCEMFGAGSQAAYSSVIEENRRQAFQQFGIEGTPAVAVNGTLLREASESAIINAIKQ